MDKMTDKRPKLIKPEILQVLKNTVPPGEYRMYSASAGLPGSISWSGSDCQCVVVAASSYNGSDIPHLPSEMTPSGNLYLVRSFRADPGGSPHWNVHDSLYYADSKDRAWRLHSKDTPDHYMAIISGSGMAELIRDYALPSASSGTLAEYRAGGAHLDFESPLQ